MGSYGHATFETHEIKCDYGLPLGFISKKLHTANTIEA
jgi:hypothetical protein